MADFQDYYKDAQLQYRQGTGVDVIPSLPHLGVQSDADRANVMNMALANMEYERNSVKNQLQQYLDAGLNPNLIYSKSEPAKFGAPTMQSDVSSQHTQRVNNILQAMSTVSGAVGMVGQFMKNVQSARLASQESWFNEQMINSRNRIAREMSEYVNLVDENGNVVNLPFIYKRDDYSTLNPELLANDIPIGDGYFIRSGTDNFYNTFDWDILQSLGKMYREVGSYDLLQSLRIGQSTRQNLMNNRLDYQNKMLDTLPPAARVIFELFSELLGTISKFK